MNLFENLPILLMGVSFLPIAHFLGRLFLHKVSFDSFEWKGLVFQAFGLGVLGYLVLAFGLSGALAPRILWGLYWVLLGFSSLVVFEWWGWVKALLRSFRDAGSFGDHALMLLGLIYFLILLIATLAPELGTDALCYHLGTPKAFLEVGKVTYLPYDINSTFPFLIQMLYLLGIALKGALLAKFFHLITGFFLFTTLFLTLRDQKVSKPFFWSLLFILTPGLTNQMTMSFTDVALAAYTFLAVMFFWKALSANRLAYYGIAGAFFGFALSIKVIVAPSLVGLAVVGSVLVLAQSFLKKDTKTAFSFVTGLGLFILCLLAASFVWYLRAYLFTGNPFFPYFGQFFGAEVPKEYAVKGMGTGISALLALPWNLAAHPTSFGNRSDQIGFLFLGLSPFLLWALWRSKEGRFFTATALVGTLGWFFLAQRVRFLYPILPIFFMAEMIGFQIFQAQYRRLGKAVQMLFWIVLLSLLALTGYHYRHHLKLATGEWSAHDLRENLERSTVITDYVNEHLPLTGTKILNSEEIHRYYFDRPQVREGLFAKNTQYWKSMKTPAEVVEFLKVQGFTHVLWAKSASSRRKDLPLSIRTLVRDPVLSPQHFEILFEARSKNKVDQVYDYALYRIQ